MNAIGFGSPDYDLAICIANRPNLDDYPSLGQLQPLTPGEIGHIVANTSNHWRKAFNVYAKFLYALQPGWLAGKAASWQVYRDDHLLQPGSREALLFSAPEWQSASESGRIHIVAGKTYAAALNLPPLIWLDAYFAVNRQYRVLVSPYLDYRQLSNERIDQMVLMVQQIWGQT